MTRSTLHITAWLAPVALASATTFVVFAQRPAPVTSATTGRDWAISGSDAANTRYSPLKEITRDNVSRLEVAWQYDPGGDARGGLQTTPLVIDGVVYAETADGRLIALDGATGTLKWSWSSDTHGQACRGITYWTDGRDRRILAGFGRYVYAIDPATGQPIASFGVNGRIDLQQDLGRDPERQSVTLTSPGVIYHDTFIVGGRVSEQLPASPGDVRAYDVRSGRLKWAFHTIPHPGEPGYETWPKDAWTYSGAANNWAGMAVDTTRGIVYVPTGSAAADFYGWNRVGNDLYANSLLALDAETGRRLWSFQGVHHDVWDRDFDSPPTLVTVRRGGRLVDAVAQTSKIGWVYLFDRVTGTPLFPIEERPVPASTVPGEVTSPTQPFVLAPVPFARQHLTEDMLTTRTPEAHAWAVEHFRALRSDGNFVPFSVGKDTVIMPGFDGGAEWGGSAWDPDRHLLFVNANDLAWTTAMRETQRRTGASAASTYTAQCASCHGADRSGGPGFPSLRDIASRRTAAEVTASIRNGGTRMPAFSSLRPAVVAALVEYLMSDGTRDTAETGAASNDAASTSPPYNFTGYHKWYDPDGYPAVAPPWGTLNAIDLDTGEYAWKIPLGEYPELAAKGQADTGTENYGGPIVTAGGLVFIGATNYDNKFRAFDTDTGRLLWQTTMMNAGNATPATYEAGGRQFVVIAAFGGKTSPRPGSPKGAFVAFALPRSTTAR
jgi:quinoprotein glucose dehydrogenase